MSIEHAALTGAQVHEPKNIETAASGTVYTSDGAGSGAWLNPTAAILNKNIYFLQTFILDVGTPSTSAWFHVPIKSKITRLNALLYTAIDVNTVLSIYINGVLFADSLTLTAAGSAAGQRKNVTLADNTIPANSIVEVRTDGAATGPSRVDVQLEMLAIA